MRSIVAAAILVLAPLAHAQSLGELSAAMGVSSAAAGAGAGSASIAHHVRDSINGQLSATGNGWQAEARSASHGASGSGWATPGGSSLSSGRTSNGWATASSAGRGSSGGGWARKDSPSQRTR